MPKGSEWQFERFLPDTDDCSAQSNARRSFFDFLWKRSLKMNEAERELFLFDAGFSRGAAWMRDKLKEEE